MSWVVGATPRRAWCLQSWNTYNSKVAGLCLVDVLVSSVSHPRGTPPLCSCVTVRQRRLHSSCYTLKKLCLGAPESHHGHFGSK